MREYFRGLFVHDPFEAKWGKVAREFFKAVLDFIRNLAVLGLLKYLAVRTESVLLAFVADLGMATLAAYIATFVWAYDFRPFHFVTDSRKRTVLDLAVIASVFLATIVGSQLLVRYVITIISKAQGH